MPSEARHETTARDLVRQNTASDGDGRTAGAYRVPWRIDRSRDPWFSLVNEGDEPVHGVHLILNGDGQLLWRPLISLAPGEHIGFLIRAEDAARDCVACVRWFRPDETEYLWRMSF